MNGYLGLHLGIGFFILSGFVILEQIKAFTDPMPGKVRYRYITLWIYFSFCAFLMYRYGYQDGSLK